MSFALLKAFVQSLRFRLMLWIGFVSVVTAMVTLWGMREGVRLTLIDEVDRVLDDDLRDVSFAIAEEQLSTKSLEEFLDRKHRSHHQEGWFVQLVDINGVVSLSKGIEKDAKISMKDSDESVESGTLHVRQVAANLPDRVGGRVRIGVDMRFISNDMARIDRLALFVGLAVFLLAPIASYYMAAGAIEPVGEMINTMSRIRASVIDERLPVRGAGDELDKLAITFNTLLDRISADIAEKRDFLANAAHELRTPLAAIRNSIEVTLNSDRSTADYQETLADVLDQCGSLQLIVNQLLLLAEAKSTQQETCQESVSLSEVIGKSLEMFEAAADVAEVRLHNRIEPDWTIEANRMHISQIVNNLIDNAIKYTPSGGSIWVELEAMETGGVEFRVRDTGIGIPNEKLPRVFERFYRAGEPHSLIAPRRGSGLGLSIVSSLVNRYGGEIEAQSTQGVGSRFVVRWPNAENGAQPLAREELSPSAPCSTLSSPN